MSKPVRLSYAERADLYRRMGRCPSWSPDPGLKCEGAKKHEGEHFAFRSERSPSNPNYRVTW